jgi:hypothetical protein
MTLVRGALHASHSRCVASEAGQPLFKNVVLSKLILS